MDFFINILIGSVKENSIILECRAKGSNENVPNRDGSSLKFIQNILL